MVVCHMWVAHAKIAQFSCATAPIVFCNMWSKEGKHGLKVPFRASHNWHHKTIWGAL